MVGEDTPSVAISEDATPTVTLSSSTPQIFKYLNKRHPLNSQIKIP